MTKATKPAKRTRRTPEVAEAEILDAAEEILTEMPFRDLTVERVMERTGMKRSNFYNYFSDRNELVMGLVRRIEDENRAGTTGWIEAESDDPVEAARVGLLATVRVWRKHAHVLRAINEAAAFDEAAQRFFREGLLEQYILDVATRLRSERDAGTSTVEDPEEVARALLLMNANYLSEALNAGVSDEVAARVLQRIWVAALYGRID